MENKFMGKEKGKDQNLGHRSSEYLPKMNMLLSSKYLLKNQRNQVQEVRILTNWLIILYGKGILISLKRKNKLVQGEKYQKRK